MVQQRVINPAGLPPFPGVGTRCSVLTAMRSFLSIRKMVRFPTPDS